MLTLFTLIKLCTREKFRIETLLWNAFTRSIPLPHSVFSRSAFQRNALAYFTYFPININKSLLTQTRLNINQNCTISFHLIFSSFLITSNLFVTFSSCTYLRYPDLTIKAFGSSMISFPRAFLFHDTLSHGTRIYRIYIYT